METTITEAFQTALDFIRYTNENVFLTGKAGTGKTTFLKYVKTHIPKKLAVVAPTGVAAINAGGTTIHSFFQLPFGIFTPESKGYGKQDNVLDKNDLIANLKITGQRRKVLQQLQLLIIDEISMVRADMLDAMNTILQYIRNNYNEPFGGVQVLFIGDMFQLPPVINDEQWKILSNYYESVYFFDSRICQQYPPNCINLTKIFRQKDEKFISILNEIRHGELRNDSLEIMNDMVNPYFKPPINDNYITLCTHNKQADIINQNELSKLLMPPEKFNAKIEGDFSERMYPIEPELILKIGSKVMFIKNDSGDDRRFFNGKIGEVVEIDKIESTISVQCINEKEPIKVSKAKWENIKYKVNENQKIEEDVLGSFQQFPLRLAWAITIHKSQGLTFEKVVIDAGSAFASGQVYVALSRCVSLEGIVLLTAINPASLKMNEKIIAHDKEIMQQENHMQQALVFSKLKYETDTLLGFFNYKLLLTQLLHLQKIIKEQDAFLKGNLNNWIESIVATAYELEKTNLKFINFINNNRLDYQSISENENIVQKIKNASNYYLPQLLEIKNKFLNFPIQIELKTIATLVSESATQCYSTLHEILYFSEKLKNGYNLSDYLDWRYQFKQTNEIINTYNTKVYISNTETNYPELFKKLSNKRDEICNNTGYPLYRVANKKSLLEMTKFLPYTEKELVKISGFGLIKAKEYGSDFLPIIKEFCELNNIVKEIFDNIIDEKITKKGKLKKDKKETPNTKLVSYDLFKLGKTIVEIALERNLAPSTIESHLAHFISIGQMDVVDFLDKIKLDAVLKILISDENEISLSGIKEKLGNDYSYCDIKYATAHHIYTQNINVNKNE